MLPKKPKNLFKYIAFEGIDGCGKTTQAQFFVNYLEKEGFCVYFTKEPGGSSGKIRDLLLKERWPSKTELFLFLADRSLNIASIRNEMGKGSIVVSDRSMYSTVAYQGYGEGLDLEFLEKLNLFSTEGLKPDVVFYFDISLETMKNRVKNLDAIESKGDNFFMRVRNGYVELCKKESNFFLINGERDREEVFENVLKIWERLLGD